MADDLDAGGAARKLAPVVHIKRAKRRKRSSRGVYDITEETVQLSDGRRYKTFKLIGVRPDGRRVREQDANERVLRVLKHSYETEDANAPDERRVNTHLTHERIRQAEAFFARLAADTKFKAESKTPENVLNHFFETFNERRTDKPIPELVQAFLDERRSETEPATYNGYKGDLNTWAKHETVAGLKLHQVRSENLDAYLRSLRCPTTGRHARFVIEDGKKVPAPVGRVRWNHVRGSLLAFFYWCMNPTRAWVTANPVLALKKFEIEFEEPHYIGAKLALEIMGYAMEYGGGPRTNKPGILVPYLSFILFGGIRPAARHGEIFKFTHREDMASLVRRDAEEPHVHIPAKVSKIHHLRNVQIRPRRIGHSGWTRFRLKDTLCIRRIWRR